MARITMRNSQKATFAQVFEVYISAVTARGVKDKTIATYKQHFHAISNTAVKNKINLTDKDLSNVLPIHPYAALLLQHISIYYTVDPVEMVKAGNCWLTEGNPKYAKALLRAVKNGDLKRSILENNVRALVQLILDNA